MSNFRTAFELAKAAHGDQKNKDGTPYFTHPLHVAMQFKGVEILMIIGVLHDVIEDTNVTLDDLSRLGFTIAVIRAIDALTKREGEEYHDAICRVAADDLALPVKIADMTHNSDLSRLGRAPTDKDLQRVAKYQHYIGELKKRQAQGANYQIARFNG